jgi:hypothetical protein
MSNTNTQTQVRGVKVSRKHTAKKLGNDIYEYRGWMIQKFDNDYLLDPEVRGVQWNTYRNREEMSAGRTIDIVDTLRDAKMYIDICINRDEQNS